MCYHNRLELGKSLKIRLAKGYAVMYLFRRLEKEIERVLP